jgi:hypothetical protein
VIAKQPDLTLNEVLVAMRERRIARTNRDVDELAAVEQRYRIVEFTLSPGISHRYAWAPSGLLK